MSAPLYATGLSRPTARPLPWWLRMLSRLPLWFLYGFAALAVWVMRRVVRHRIATVRTNIERSFPHVPRRARRAIQTGYYRNLSQMLAEVLKMGTMQQGDLQQ